MSAPFSIGPLLSQSLEERKRATTEAGKREAEIISDLSRPTDFGEPTTPKLEALPMFLSALLGNTASALTGNPQFAASAQRQIDEVRAEQREARQQQRQLTVQDIAARRQNLLALKVNALDRQYQAAVKAGDNEQALKVLDLQLKATKELQDERIKHDASEGDKNRTLEGDLRREGFDVQRDIAALQQGLTGDPTIDNRLKSVNAYRGLIAVVDDAMKATKAKNLTDFLKKNPQYGTLINLAEGVISRPIKGENAQAYASFMESVFGTDRATKLVKQHFPNEEIKVSGQKQEGLAPRFGRSSAGRLAQTQAEAGAEAALSPLTPLLVPAAGGLARGANLAEPLFNIFSNADPYNMLRFLASPADTTTSR